MQVIIPMSGTGQRFLNAGYKVPKTLIEVDKKPIIEHVVNLFPREKNLTFICNSDQLATTDLKAVLNRIAPHSRIVPIAPHKKGPVYAVAQIFETIDDDDEVIVNYCDFSKYWDYQDFLKHTRSRAADGAISAYRGFHPHMLGTTNYAFMRSEKQWMLEIREKEPFTDNRMEEYASDGTYYFRKGLYVKKYFRLLMDEDINTNGEYYVSMVYNLMKKDGLKISIYEIQHMLQWGAPRDLEEYKTWSRYFESLVKPRDNIKPMKGSINLIPMAGKGARFAREGYRDPKPLIPVSGKPMIVQAAGSLPQADKNIFVALADHLDNYPMEKEIKKFDRKAEIVRLDKVTEGQASTCEAGLKGENLNAPLLIGACDNGMLWDRTRYERLIDSKAVDVIVWSFRRHPSSERNPKMYGWVETKEDDTITRVSVKSPISSHPYDDHAIVGTFYFRKAAFFMDALKRLYEKDVRVNNEYYVDSCINEALEMGLKAKVFEVDAYISWGMPDDLKCYKYWQSFFHKCDWHPYTMEKDVMMDKSRIAEYDAAYRKFNQRYR